MNYYISDLHLFHEASIKYDDRPFSTLEEMHSAIMKNWNDTVTNGDTVYILGDISMRGTNEELIAFVAKLKGQKVLIKRNHDQVKDFRYKQLFSEMHCRYEKGVQACNRTRCQSIQCWLYEKRNQLYAKNSGRNYG